MLMDFSAQVPSSFVSEHVVSLESILGELGNLEPLIGFDLFINIFPFRECNKVKGMDKRLQHFVILYLHSFGAFLNPPNTCLVELFESSLFLFLLGEGHLRI